MSIHNELQYEPFKIYMNVALLKHFYLIVKTMYVEVQTSY